MRKTYTATISLPPLLAKKAQRVMQKEGRTRSELFREALRRYLSEETEEQLLMEELQIKARRLGIKNEEEVTRMIDTLRM